MAGHEVVGLDVEVSEHGVRLPASDELDDVAVHGLVEEGHCAGGPKRLCGNVGGLQAERVGAPGEAGLPEQVGDGLGR